MIPGTLYSIDKTLFRKRIIRSIPMLDVFKNDNEWYLESRIEASPKQILMYEKTIESDEVVPGFRYVAHVFLTSDIHTNESVEVIIDDDNLAGWNLVQVGHTNLKTTQDETETTKI